MSRNYNGAGLELMLEYIFATLCTLSVAFLIREWAMLDPSEVQVALWKQFVSIRTVFSFLWAIAGMVALRRRSVGSSFI